MNYLKVYCNLIRKAENRTLVEGYTEKHHTFPKSIFGKNKRVVVLTAREHYIAHALLERVCIKRYGLNHYRTHKMTYAFWMMCNTNGRQNSYLYEELKIRRSNILKSLAGENHFNRGKKRSPETIEKLRKASTGKKLSIETRKKLSELKRGKNHPYYGKTHTEETRRKISENRKEKYFHTKEWKEMIGEMNRGEKNPFFGKKHTEETKEKMRAKKLSNKTKEKLSEINCKLKCNIISPDGEIFFTENLPKFCREVGICYCGMHRVVSGKRKTHKGWTGVVINK